MSKFILVASDVHSDEETFETLCKIASSADCLGFIYAGDLNIENYFISTCLRNRNFNFISVRGNCDHPFSFLDADLPSPPLYRSTTINKVRIFITHGHLYSDPESAGFSNSDFDIVINGHSHITELKRENDFIFLNPGSPSSPRGYSGRTYAKIEFTDESVTVKTYILGCKEHLSALPISLSELSDRNNT